MTPSGADPRTPATIVSHPEYPHWGPGYVFRTRKTAADIFFQWGGKRTIPDQDLDGVSDEGRNSASANGNPAQCTGVLCS